MCKTQSSESKLIFMARSIILLLLVIMILSACETMPWQKKSAGPTAIEPLDTSAPYTAPDVAAPGLQLSSEQRFKDVPLPTGLKEDVERTFVFESASLQIGRMVYTSRASVFELTQFYIRECPTTDWKLQDVLEAQAKTLVFTKPGRRLVVVVQDMGPVKGRRLMVTLTPEGGSGFGL